MIYLVAIQTTSMQPFNAGYVWFNTSNNVDIADTSKTKFNSYLGGVFQQATSAVTLTSESKSSLHLALTSDVLCKTRTVTS
jgi:hypothetical protein